MVSFIGGENHRPKVSFIGGENHRPNVSHRQTSSHMLYRVHLAVRGIQIPNLVVIGTDCIVSGNFNYQTSSPTLYGSG